MTNIFYLCTRLTSSVQRNCRKEGYGPSAVRHISVYQRTVSETTFDEQLGDFPFLLNLN